MLCCGKEWRAIAVNLLSTFDNLKSGCKPDKHWVLTTCQPIFKKIAMKYKIVQEKKPTLKTFGLYKAVAVHSYTITPDEIISEMQANTTLKRSDILAVLEEYSETVLRHLKRGDRVRMRSLGLAKLEIESDKVPDASDFTACKHIRGVRLHLIPESEKGSQPLYEDIKYEKMKG
jgi:hypothetical protein